MDHMDQKIIEALKVNGRLSAASISREIGLSLPAVTERIRKLEEEGTILGYAALVSRHAVGLNLLAFIFVDLDIPANIPIFRAQISAEEAVMECHHMAGEHDYLLKVAVTDTEALEDFLSNRLKSMAGVIKTHSVIVLSTLKEEPNV